MKKYLIIMLFLFCSVCAEANSSDSEKQIWNISKAIPLPYVVYDAQWDHRKAIKRSKLAIRLAPATYDTAGNVINVIYPTATAEQIAATAIAAAKYYGAHSGATSVSVVLDAQIGVDSVSSQLAVADYAPDGKGISGTDNWTWQYVKAARTPFSQSELEMQYLWSSMRGQFQTASGTDEARLSEAIAQKMGITASEVTLPFRTLSPVPQELIDAVPAQAGLSPKTKQNSTQNREFPFTKDAIVQAYNDTMQMILKFRPLDPSRETMGGTELVDIRSYMVSPNVAVVFQINKGSRQPTHVKAVGVEDGTEQTRALIVFNCMTLMAAVTPDWHGDERGEVGKKLGITGTFPSLGNMTTLSYKGCDFAFANNGKLGLTLTMSPSAQ